jgi:hypothetical protein
MSCNRGGKKALLNWPCLRGLVESSLLATQEIGATDREIESRQSIGLGIGSGLPWSRPPKTNNRGPLHKY